LLNKGLDKGSGIRYAGFKNWSSACLIGEVTGKISGSEQINAYLKHKIQFKF